MIFISHSSHDKAAALVLQQELIARGYHASQLFLDSDEKSGIPAGAKWEQALFGKLKRCRALVVLCSGNWQRSLWCFAELVFAKIHGKPIFPVMLEDCALNPIASEHQAVFLWKEGQAAYKRLFEALVDQHLGPRDEFGWPPSPDACPYPGLFAFDEKLAGVYFGREDETQLLLQELRMMRASGQPRLLTIVGGSGSGKSSLLKAGVLPRLKHQAAQPDWVVLPTFRYSDCAAAQREPFDFLAVHLASQFPQKSRNGVDWKTIRCRLASNNPQLAARRFLQTVQDLTIARGCPDASVLLPIDQFEELLAPTAGPLADAFLDFLRALFSCRNRRVLGIATLRSDHLDFFEKNRRAFGAPYFHPWRLGPFPRERLQEVIRKPGERAGVSISDELVERLKLDTPTSEALPLLAFTLEKLYRARGRSSTLEIRAYTDGLGGIEGAIQKCIQQAIPESITPDEMRALRLSFITRLAQTNDKGEVVRLRARWEDLPKLAHPILDTFVNEHLLYRHTTESSYGRNKVVNVEVAHEAMFRCWDQLRNWIHTSADILRWRADVRRDQANDQNWKILRPAQLAVAREWPVMRQDELSEEEKGWIESAIWWQKLRRLGLAAVVLILAAATGLAWSLKLDADKAKSAAERSTQFLQAQTLVTEIRQRKGDRPLQSLLLAVAAVKISRLASPNSPLPAAHQALRDTLSNVGGMPLMGHSGAINAMAASPNGRWLATCGSDKTVQLWDLSLDEPARHPLLLEGHEKAVVSAAFSQDSRWLVTFGEDPTLRLWDLNAKVPAAKAVVLRGHSGPVTHAEFTADGRWLGSVSGDGTARIWAMSASGMRAQSTVINPGPPPPTGSSVIYTPAIEGVSFSADSRWLLTKEFSEVPRIRPLQDFDSVHQPRKLDGDWIGFSSDSRWSITAADGGLNILDLSEEAVAKPLHVAGRSSMILVGAAALSPDSRWAALGTDDGPTQLLDLHSPTPRSFTLGAESRRMITRTVFSPDNRWLVTVGEVLTLWNIQAPDPSASAVQLSDAGKVDSVIFSPDGRWLFTFEEDYPGGDKQPALRIWDAHSSRPDVSPLVIPRTPPATKYIAFSRNNHFALISGPESSGWLCDLSRLAATAEDARTLGKFRNQQCLQTLNGHEAQIDQAAFSENGRWLVTRTENKSEAPRIWNLRAMRDVAQPLQLVDRRTNIVESIAVSADSNQVITGEGDGLIRIWNLRAVDPALSPMKLNGHADFVYSVAISGDGRWLLSGGQEKIARLWDMQHSDPSANAILLTGHETSLRLTDFTPNGRWMVTWGGSVQLWDLHAPSPSEKPIVLQNSQDEVGDVACSPDGRWLATSGKDGSVRLWALNDPAPPATAVILKGHRAPVLAMSFSGDSRWLVTGSEDQTGRLWDLQSSDPSAGSVVLSENQDRVRLLACSRDGRWLLTGSGGVARLWDLHQTNPAAKAIPLLNQHNITAMAISADSRWAVTSSILGTRLWDLQAADPAAHPIELGGSAKSVVFTPDNRWIVMNDGGQVRLFLLQIDDLLDRAREVTGRSLSEDEWEIYQPGQKYFEVFPKLPKGYRRE